MISQPEKQNLLAINTFLQQFEKCKRSLLSLQTSCEKLNKNTVTVLVFWPVCSYLICRLYDSISNLWVKTIVLIYFSSCSLQDAKSPYNLNLRHKSKFKYVIFFPKGHFRNLVLNQAPPELKSSSSPSTKPKSNQVTWPVLPLTVTFIQAVQKAVHSSSFLWKSSYALCIETDYMH